MDWLHIVAVIALVVIGVVIYFNKRLVGYLERAAIDILENVDGVVLLGEGGGKVFAAEVVDHGEAGSLVFDVGRGDEPAVGVVPLTKVAGQFA